MVGSLCHHQYDYVIINDISNFTVEGCVLNMYGDDVIIYTSGTSKYEL